MKRIKLLFLRVEQYLQTTGKWATKKDTHSNIYFFVGISILVGSGVLVHFFPAAENFVIAVLGFMGVINLILLFMVTPD